MTFFVNGFMARLHTIFKSNMGFGVMSSQWIFKGAKALYHKTYNVGLRKYNCFGSYSDSEEDTSLDIDCFEYEILLI